MIIYQADTLLNIYHADKDDEVETHIWFTVEKSWAENWVKEGEIWNSLEEFDSDYIWDNGLDMYEAALDEEALIEVEYRITSHDDIYLVGGYPHTRVTGEEWSDLLEEWSHKEPNMKIDELIAVLQKAKKKGVKEIEFQVYKWQEDLEDKRYHLAHLFETCDYLDTLTMYIS